MRLINWSNTKFSELTFIWIVRLAVRRKTNLIWQSTWNTIAIILYNPSFHKCDWLLISLYIIALDLNMKIMRIKELIINSRSSWLLNNFSLVSTKGNVKTKVWRIWIFMLGCKRIIGHCFIPHPHLHERSLFAVPVPWRKGWQFWQFQLTLHKALLNLWHQESICHACIWSHNVQLALAFFLHWG